MSMSVVPSRDTTSMSTLRHGIIEVLKWISIAIFAVLVLVVLWQVIARQVLGLSLIHI